MYIMLIIRGGELDWVYMEQCMQDVMHKEQYVVEFLSCL